MINLVFILIFIFCFAIGIASILISHQFISTYNTDFHKNYFYYLVSFYAFALYAIWGHILIRIVLEGLNSRPEVVETVSNFSSILGLPFLFLSWIMLLNMAHSLYDMKVKRWWIGYHVGMFILLILGVWIGYDVLPDSDFLEEKSVRYIQISYISIFGLINYSVFLALIRIFNGKKKVIGQFKILIFSMLIVIAFLLQITVMVFAFWNIWTLAIVIFIFFASNLFPLMYLKINSDFIFQPVRAENTNEEIIERISKKYQITRRECEIVRHICIGKTNQQIADDLFISLQTVKDHTHRIYSKIGINSRMQLVQLVNG